MGEADAADVPFAIYPNPTSGSFTVDLPAEKADISVTNVLGELVMQVNATNRTTYLQLENTGLYLIHLRTEQGSLTRTLIVDR